ncbi:hypothetical protein AS9A_1703 [Hoyosella subflava DQS3-9A1]|uniref:Uncharacterized protein n=1 Tax=Hoyosella subflava (strain DSM 45089 / JCM 17490 / NBRC 109087 / DQS3-9A1) TaxID=443218 RepID=F6EKL6_HOYSD|nr:hypothetical protein AS9A_1703 [Hoyosella subflava DQS3-9A1]
MAGAHPGFRKFRIINKTYSSEPIEDRLTYVFGNSFARELFTQLDAGVRPCAEPS